MQGMKDRERNIKANVKLDKLNPLVGNAEGQQIIPKTIQPGERVPDVRLAQNEPEGMSKVITDLTENLRALFFENKTMQKNIQDLDKRRSNADVQLERLMKEKQLVRVNGTLQM